MTVYKQCPFCEELFEIGSEGHEPMRRHLRTVHADDERVGDRHHVGGRAGPPTSACLLDDVKFGLLQGRDEASTRGLLVALVCKHEVLVPVVAQWYGVPETTVRVQFERLDARLSERPDDEPIP